MGHVTTEHGEVSVAKGTGRQAQGGERQAASHSTAGSSKQAHDVEQGTVLTTESTQMSAPDPQAALRNQGSRRAKPQERPRAKPRQDQNQHNMPPSMPISVGSLHDLAPGAGSQNDTLLQFPTDRGPPPAEATTPGFPRSVYHSEFQQAQQAQLMLQQQAQQQLPHWRSHPAFAQVNNQFDPAAYGDRAAAMATSAMPGMGQMQMQMQPFGQLQGSSAMPAVQAGAPFDFRAQMETTAMPGGAWHRHCCGGLVMALDTGCPRVPGCTPFGHAAPGCRPST
jgi:hypothetical protein